MHVSGGPRDVLWPEQRDLDLEAQRRRRCRRRRVLLGLLLGLSSRQQLAPCELGIEHVFHPHLYRELESLQ